MVLNKNITAIITCLMLLMTSFNLFSQTENLQSIRQRAYNGDPQAMIELAQYYKSNDNQSLADSWLKKAEETSPGCTKEAQNAIAIEKELYEADKNADYEDGMGSLNTYLKYIDSNNVHAMVGLGRMYERGYTVGKDLEEAANWYQKAINIDPDKAFKCMDLNGEFALSLVEKDANKGNVKSMFLLAKYYESEGDLNEAQIWYKKAAKTGDVEAKHKNEEVAEAIEDAKFWEEYHQKEREQNRQVYNETMRNFAGVWTCRNSYTQFKFDSNGNGWFRNGSGIAWESLGVYYLGKNKIKVYDAHAIHILVFTGNSFTQDDTYVYYRQ